VSSSELGKIFQQTYGEILKDLIGKQDLLVSLSHLHGKEGYLFHHSVNVAILAGIIGISKGYNRNQLMDLGVGALLFDIGMTFFPDDLWKNNTEFTLEKRERVQKHTEEGFNLLRKQEGISLLSAHCALQHHERYDGTGYPRGLKGDEIHEYAQIVSIADVYGALTSPRSYRPAYSPGEAIEFLYANGNKWFNVDLIRSFVSHIAIYPVSSTVLLNTGQIGVVVSNNPLAPNRPLVRIIQEPAGQSVESPYDIDLHNQHNLTITEIL
jgi:HD-GYP domain-containing protein (c-di-GMP phosphodiesterase class II)